MKKIVVIVSKITIFTFLALSAIILVTSKIETPLGIRSFVVLTGSMQPGISAGSIIFTQNALNYNEGDIIAFKNGNVTVTHRIVNSEIKNGRTFFRTKGDANNAADDKEIDSSMIYGRELITIPLIGNLILFTRTIPGFLIFIITPALLFIGFEFVSIKKELEKQIAKKYQANVMRKLSL